MSVNSGQYYCFQGFRLFQDGGGTGDERRGRGLVFGHRGWRKVSDYRDRFGAAEEQSYRLRRMRGAVKHSARRRVHGSV